MQPNNGQKLPPNKWKFLGFFQASEASPLSSPTFWQVSEARCISLSAKGNTQYLKTQPTESRTRHWNFMQSRCPGFSCVFTDATRNWLPAVRGTTALLPWHFYRPPLLAFQLHSVGPPPALAGRKPGSTNSKAGGYSDEDKHTKELSQILSPPTQLHGYA